MIYKCDEHVEGETLYVHRNFHQLLARSDALTFLPTTLLYIVVGDSSMFDHR